MPVYAHSHYATPHAANVAALVDDLSALGVMGAMNLLESCRDALADSEDAAAVHTMLTGGVFCWPFPDDVDVEAVVRDALAEFG